VLVSEEARFDHDCPGRRSEEECFIGWAKPRSEGNRIERNYEIFKGKLLLLH